MSLSSEGRGAFGALSEAPDARRSSVGVMEEKEGKTGYIEEITFQPRVFCLLFVGLPTTESDSATQSSPTAQIHIGSR